jgi:hypothetical protein
MQTQVIKLCCQGCGADLQVTEEVRFVTCNYCQSKLEIVRDASVTHTRVLEKLEKTTERIAENLRVIELQNDLERMDREWETMRQGMMIREKDGGLSEPSTVASVIAGFVFILGGVVFSIVSGAMGAPGFFPLFGLLFVGVGFFNLITGPAKAARFRNLQDSHEMRRNRLIRALEKERRR